MRLTELLKLPVAHATGQHLGRLEDAILDLDARQVAYWRINLGGRFRAVPILVTASRVAVEAEQVKIHLNLDAIDDARTSAEKATRPVVDPANLPPMLPLSGPYGYGAMMPLHASFGARDAAQTMPDGAPESWIWAKDVLEKPMFSLRGELGQISDIDLDTAANVLTDVLVRGRNGETVFVDGDALRHIPEGHTHFVARSRSQRSAGWRPQATA